MQESSHSSLYLYNCGSLSSVAQCPKTKTLPSFVFILRSTHALQTFFGTRPIVSGNVGRRVIARFTKCKEIKRGAKWIRRIASMQWVKSYFVNNKKTTTNHMDS